MANLSYDPARRAYIPVDLFERELETYCNSPHAITTSSCTNSLLLALAYYQRKFGLDRVKLPRKTYIGCLQTVLNLRCEVEWWPEEADWKTWYLLMPTNVVDSARDFRRDVYADHAGRFVCLSFHSAKQLPLRGGAILTDDAAAAEWLRAARMDGRPPGKPLENTVFPGFHCPMPPDVAARGLDILSRWTDTDFSPPPLPEETYPDLSQLDWEEPRVAAEA